MKNLHLLLLPLIVIICGTFISCDSPTDPARPTVLMPLAIGNEWIGRTTYHDGSPATYDTVRIVADTIINGERWFVAGNKNLYINRADGLYTIYAADRFSPNKPARERQEKFPVALGDTVLDLGEIGVLINGEPGGIFHDHTEVTAVGIPIDLPIGTRTGFETQFRRRIIEQGKYRMHTREHDRIYYVPNLGRVKYVFYTPSSAPVLMETWELISANLK